VLPLRRKKSTKFVTVTLSLDLWSRDILKTRAGDERHSQSAHIRELLKRDFEDHQRRQNRQIDRLILSASEVA
jgi:hypothetical protein